MKKLTLTLILAATLITAAPARAGESNEGTAPAVTDLSSIRAPRHELLNPANPHAAKVREMRAELARQAEQILNHQRWLGWNLAGTAILNIRYYLTFRTYQSHLEAYKAWETAHPGGPRPPVLPGRPGDDIRPGGPARPVRPFPPAVAGQLSGRIVVADLSNIRPTGNRPAASVQILRTLPITVRIAGRHVIRNYAEMHQILQGPFPGSTERVPMVDFEREMVLVASMGSRGGGHSIEIVNIRRSLRSLEVSVRETTPAPGAIIASVGTWPTHAVVVARQSAPVTWVNAGPPDVSNLVDGARPGVSPLAGAVVEIYPAGPARIGARPSMWRVTTDADGRFSFQGLRPLNYQIRISCPGYDTAQHTVRAPRQGLTIRMRKSRIARIDEIRPAIGDEGLTSAEAPVETASAPSTGTGDVPAADPAAAQTTLLGISMR